MQRLVINIEQKKEEKFYFNQEQYHYIFRVLRLTIDDKIIVMDGMGNSWIVELQDNYGRIVEKIATDTELSLEVTLLVALPKGNGFDDIVRCCTELGVKRIVPLESDRTILKPSQNKWQRWQKIAQEAAEQSERSIVPLILEPLKFKQIFNEKSPLKELLSTSNKYICLARGDKDHLINIIKKEQKNIIIATGPEGGWTDTEIQLATNNNFQPVSLGNRILRAVTAPITVMSIISAMAQK